MRRLVICLMLVCGFCPSAQAEDAPPAKAAATDAPKWPRLGGHFGLALTIFTADNDANTVIGRDFVQIGITPGITLKLSDRWAIDFEFIGFSKWNLKPTGVPNTVQTIWVVDPGVVYNFGPVSAGLRLAMQIGEGIGFNMGLVPIVVVPFKLTEKLSYFLELDLPIFVFGTAGVPATAFTPAIEARAIGSFNILLQTGFAF